MQAQEQFLDDQDIELRPSQDNATQAPEENLQDYENNNKEQRVEPAAAREAQAAAEEEANPGLADLEDSSLEEDNQPMEFFPQARSYNARMAEREDHKRQLNVHGLTPEFPRGSAGGKIEKELLEVHGELVKQGFKFRPQNIIGARPTSNTARNGPSSPMRVTYDSADT